MWFQRCCWPCRPHVEDSVCKERERAQPAEREKRALWHLIFCFWSLRSSDISVTVCLFVPSYVGLAKQSQFLLLAMKMEKKTKEEKELHGGGEKNTRMKLLCRLQLCHLEDNLS